MMHLSNYVNGGPGIRRYRQSLRKTASVSVWLRTEHQGPIWEEETETQDLSRHGAGLRCRHLVQTDSTLVIIRRDNGSRATARVRYSQYNSDGNRELGIEFIERDNFWDLEWDTSEPVPAMPIPVAASMEVPAESAIAPTANYDLPAAGDAPKVLALIQEAVDVVEIAPVPDSTYVAAHASRLDPDASAAQAVPSPVQEVTEVPWIVSSRDAGDIGVGAIEPAVQAETEIAELVPGLVTNESTVGASAPLSQEAVRVVVIVPNSGAYDRAAEASALPVREVAEVPHIVSSSDAGDNAVDLISAPVQEESAIEEIAPSLVTDESTADSSSAWAREAAEEEVPQTVPAVSQKEEPPPPSFLSFYGLSGQPFDVTPDPEYLYLSDTHRQALTSLSQGIENVRGFMALIAKPGMGKTTLLNKLMEDLRDSTRIAFLFQTQCNSRQLLRYLLSELGVEDAGKDVVTMHKALNEILFHEMLNGRRVVLIVDEAQNLHDSVLETIRLLSDFETTHTKLIQIILSGQPTLVETLLRPSLSQLRQRIAILTSLQPLSAADTAQYIDHRLRTAGLSGKPIFTHEALTLIAERSKGIPRIINNLCFNALLGGCSRGSNLIDLEIVQTVVANLDLESLVRRPL